MTDFNPEQHPRATSGTFTNKAQGAPEVQLDSDGIHIPDGQFHGVRVGPGGEPDSGWRRTAGIAGYTYKADIYSPENLVELLMKNGELAPAAAAMNVEEALDQLAGANAVDREDEYSFDSDDFPKVITDSQVTVHEHPALGLQYWDTPEYNDEPLTAEDALADWLETEQIMFDDFNTGTDGSAEAEEALRERLFQSSNVALTAEENIAVIQQNAINMGLDLVKIGYPLPVRHN